MKPTQSLDVYTHSYPAWLLKHPNRIELFYGLSYLIHLRKWYIYPAIKKLLGEQGAAFALLDVGVGEGQYFFSFAKQYKSSQFSALDKAPSNIRFCERYAEQAHLRNVSLKVQDLADLAEDSSFDIVLCLSVLQYVSNANAALANLYRALRPGGKMVLYLPVNNRQAIPLYHRLCERWDNYETIQNRQRIYTDKELEHLLEQSGFSIVRKTVTYGYCGRLSNELFNLSLMLFNRAKWYYQWIILVLLFLVYPFILLLMLVDYAIPRKRTGNGMLVVAEKK